MTQSDPPAPSNGISGFISDISVALGFLSRLPTSGAEISAGRLARASRAFPIAGLGIGALATIVFIVASMLGLGAWIAALLTIAALAWLTRALHEDGLADFADGLGAATRARRLEVMRDSRIGTFGVIALGIALALRVAALAELQAPTLVGQTLIASAALSRAVMVVLMARLPLARPDGMAHHAGQPGREQEIVAIAIGLAAAFLLLPWIPALFAVAAAAIGAALVGWLARGRLGGVTGDALGAAQQVAETGFLLAVVALLA